METDRTSKRRKKSTKRSYDSSASEDEGRSKRRRGIEVEEKRGKKSDKKEKRKDKKPHKHHSDKEKKSKDKHKQKHHKSGHRSKHGFPELSANDYFSKNNEFATWLKERKNIFFSDLSSESSRELFSDFVKAWNNGKLDSRYYEGIVSGPRTAHNWKIEL